MFLQGLTPYGIAKQLTAEGVPTPGGKTKWTDRTVRSILTNEKYKGDALLQKSFCTDFLTKKFVPNTGQIPQYYVEGDHEAIIEPEVFEQVQKMIASRHRGKNRYSGTHLFSGKIRCPQCGGWYGSKVWHSNDKYRRIIWQCNHKFEGQKCTTPHLSEETIKEKFIIAVNQLLTERKQAVKDFTAARDTVFDISALTAKQAELENEMNLISGMMHQALRDNASVAQDQNEWSRQFDALEQRMNDAKSKYESVSAEITDKLLRQSEMDEFFAYLKKQKSAVTIFTDDMWLSLTDHVTVYDKNDIRFTFRNGTEI